MLISHENFIKFKELYKEEFGEEEYNKMTEQQLFESATKLITLMRVVYKHTDSSQDKLNKAYDTLFEETLKRNDPL